MAGPTKPTLRDLAVARAAAVAGNTGWAERVLGAVIRRARVKRDEVAAWALADEFNLTPLAVRREGV